MKLLGDDGRGYELARKLESHGVWRSWLGDSLYNNSGFVHFLSSPAAWEAFMRIDSSKTRAQIHLQLRARALLFDKASVSLFVYTAPTMSTAAAVSVLNPNYLRLHGDDVYYTLEDCSSSQQQRDCAVAAANSASLKAYSKASFGAGSKFGESEIDNTSQSLPETWYSQFFDKYKTSNTYLLSLGDRDIDKRTPEKMASYLNVLEKYKRSE